MTQTAVLDALPAHVAVLDSRGMILSVNRSWRRFARANGLRSRDYGVGRNYAELCDAVQGPEAAEARHAAASLRAVLAGEAAQDTLEYPCHGPAEQRWYRMSVTPWFEGGASGAVVMHVDITERKRAEAALRSSADLLRAVAAGTPDAIFVKDRQGRYLFCNEAVARFSGTTVAALIGQDNTLAFGAEAARGLIEGDRQVLETGATLTTENVLTGVGGTRTFRAVKAPYRNEHGEVVGVLGISRDVTERKLEQEEVRRLADRLSTTLESLNDGFCTLDRDWRFTYVNGKAEQLLGRLRQALLGQTLWEQVAELLGSPFEAALRRAMAAQEAVQLVERFVPLDRWYEVRILPSALGLAVYTRDVSREHTLAAQLQAERSRLVDAQAVARIGSWATDLATLEIEWSEETHRIFETDPRQFRPTFAGFRERVHPDDRAGIDAIFERSLTEYGAQLNEHRLWLPSGVHKVVEERWHVLRDEKGAPVRAFGTCQDITERKRTEQALNQSQALFSMASRLAQVGGWSVDMPSARVIWSDAVAAIHDEAGGFQPSGEQAFAYFVPEHRENVRLAFEACMRDGAPFDLELEIITGRNRRTWVRLIGEGVRDATGAIWRIQGAMQDLTERKQAERATRRLALRLSNALESITDGFYTVDLDWRFTYVNDTAIHMLQRSREELLGRVLWEEFAPALGTDFEHNYRRAVADNCKVAFDAWYAPLNSWRRVNAYPSPEGLTVVFRDVSVEREAHRQLKLLEASVSQLHDMLLIIEAPSHKSAGPQIRFVNEAVLRNTGYSREELIGSPPSLFHGPLTDRAELARMRALAERGEPVQAQLLHYRKNGEVFWVEINLRRVGLEGSSEAYLVSVERDITERKRDQDALGELNAQLEDRVLARTAELNLARDEAEQANLAKSTFLATMSHEIRTPMNGVIGVIDVLHQTPLQTHQLEMVDLIRDSASSLLDIVEDILDFSKIEAGKLDLETAPMYLRRVTERVCDMLRPMAAKQGVQLALWIDPAMPDSVLGDQVRLRQVLVNLLGNAIKFSSGLARPGQVSVQVRLAGHLPRAVTVDLVVADNGIGMDDASLARLFTPFSQADNSTTRRFGGTGLGLAISSTLVRLMGGEILVRSALGQGSTFTVRMQFDLTDEAVAAGAPPPQQAPAPAVAPPRRQGLILVAEDNETNRKVIMLQLQLIGFAAEVVVDGQEALRCWRRGGHALLLTDLHMPEADGYALARAIRAEEGRLSLQRLPIIAVTANALRDEAQRCRDAGMDGHLTKPVRLEQLRLTIEAWLGPSPLLNSPPAVSVPGAPADGAVLDLNVLVALVGDDPVVIEDLLQDFRKSATQSGAIMRSGLGTGTSAAAMAAGVAHKLKSGARAIGAQRLARVCEEIDSLPESGDTARLAPLLLRFEDRLTEVLRLLDQR